MKYIKSINWITTYKCNLKCSHCDIWSNPDKNMLSLDEIDTIFGSKILKDSYDYYGDIFDIAISWGEPMLLENIEEIMDRIDSLLPWAIHSISTNGVLEKKLISVLLYWKKTGRSLKKINISMDGNNINHDMQRWTPGSFIKSIGTITKIKKIFPEQIIEIKLTITKQNYKDILYISKLAQKLWVFFSFKPVENMTNYTNQWWDIASDFSHAEIEEIEKQIYDNIYIQEQKQYISPKFFHMIPKYLKNWLGKIKKSCQVANESVTLMPDGKTYGCILMESVGSTKSQSLQELWSGDIIEKQRKDIQDGKCPECMLMCWSFKSKNMYA